MTHPNTPADAARSLLPWPYDAQLQCYLGPQGLQLYVLHRLDSPTSGLLLVTPHAQLATWVKAAFAQRQVKKTYCALVRGHLPFAHADWHDKLGKSTQHSSQGKQYVRATGHTRRGPQGSMQAAHTRVCTLRHHTGYSLLELRPTTGLTHQLRIQCAQRHHPILGDQTYGDFGWNKAMAQQWGPCAKRLFLHASRLQVPLPLAGGSRSPVAHFAAALPQAFDNLMGAQHPCQ
jgi:23S rRNA-/tRNA-specific pseudouridylate synthase